MATTGSEVSGTIDVKVAASSEAGIVSVTVTENGTVIETDIESPWGVTWEAGTLEREVTLAAVCIASDGAEAVDAVTVSVVESGTEDFEATLTRPQEGDPVSGDVIIKAAVGGGNGPASVAFWVDDTEIFVDTESPWEMTWDSTTWPDGAAVLGVTGVETKTGIEVSDSINVTLTNDG